MRVGPTTQTALHHVYWGTVLIRHLVRVRGLRFQPPNIIERYPRAKSLQYKVAPTVYLPLDLIFSEVATLNVQIKYVVHSPIVHKVLLRLCVLGHSRTQFQPVMLWAARRCKANSGRPQLVTDVSKGCHICDGYVAGVRSVGKTKISAKTRAVLRKNRSPGCRAQAGSGVGVKTVGVDRLATCGHGLILCCQTTA